MDGKGDVEVSIRLTSDTGGSEKAEKALKRVKDAANRTSGDAKGAFDRMQAAAGRVSSAFGAMGKILGGFGIGAFAAAMTGGIKKIQDSFNASGKAAQDLFDVQRRLAEEKGIARLAADYAKLTDAISAAAKAEGQALDMIDLKVQQRRRLADARIEAAKEDEVSRLDPKAKDYAERLDVIEKKYAAIREARSASDAREDVVLQRQRLNAEAGQLDERAAAQDAGTSAIRARIAALRREKSAAESASVDLNDEDKTGALTAVGKTLKQLFTGDWGRMAGAKTAEGDAVRLLAAEKSADLEKRIMALEEELRKSDEQAKSLRSDAAGKRERAERMGGMIEVADLNSATAERRSERSSRAALDALQENRQRQADEAAKLEDARRARELLGNERNELLGKIAVEQGRKDDAGYAVYQAQGAYDAAALGGDGRAKRSAFADLRSAQDAAQNVNFAADQAIQALTKTLQGVEARLKKAQAYLDGQEKRRRYEWSEAPGGE